MPMHFLDIASLIDAAAVNGFRAPHAEESEEQFREALADHVKSIDFVESLEIRYKVWP